MLLLVRIHITLYTYAHSTYKMMIRLHTYLSLYMRVVELVTYLLIDWHTYVDIILSFLTTDFHKLNIGPESFEFVIFGPYVSRLWTEVFFHV